MFSSFNSRIKIHDDRPASPLISDLYKLTEGGSTNEAKKLIQNYISEKPDWKFSDFNIGKRTLLAQTCGHGNLNLVKFLTDEIGFPTEENGAFVFQETVLSQRPPICVAAHGGYLSIVNHLLRKGEKLEASGETGDTALITACSFGFKDLAQFLIEAGADVSHATIGGWTCLISAAKNQHFDIVKMLIEYGVDLDQIDSDGYSAIHYCSQHSSTEVLQLLIKHGAKVGTKSAMGESFLVYAALHGSSEVIGCIKSTLVDTLDPEDYANFLELLGAVKLSKNFRSKEGFEFWETSVATRENANNPKQSCNVPTFLEIKTEFVSIGDVEKLVKNQDIYANQSQVCLVSSRILGASHPFSINVTRALMNSINDPNRKKEVSQFLLKLLLNNLNSSNFSAFNAVVEDQVNFVATAKPSDISGILLDLVLEASLALVTYQKSHALKANGVPILSPENTESLSMTLCRLILVAVNNSKSGNSEKVVDDVVKKDFRDSSGNTLLHSLLNPKSHKTRFGKQIYAYPNVPGIQKVAEVFASVSGGQTVNVSGETPGKFFSVKFQKFCTPKVAETILGSVEKRSH